MIYLELESPGYQKWTKKLPELNRLNAKRGYPLHIAVLTHKFDSLLRMVKLCKVPRRELKIDPTVKSHIGANIIHLLFVKYERDSQKSKEILHELIQIPELDLNHIDQMKAAPLHIAMRKR